MKTSALALCLALTGCGATVALTDAGRADADADAGRPTQDVPRPPADSGADATVTDVQDAADASRVCERTADCPAGLRCVFSPTSACGESDFGVCRETAGCESLPVAPQYCGCDGRTFTVPNACPPDRPFTAVGPCAARDGGAADVPTDAGPRPFAGARMVWQSPGGFAGWGPAVMVTGDGVVRAWTMQRGFDALGTPPPDATETRVSPAQVDDLFARWERAPLTGLPHGPSRPSDCYPTVTVQRCATCMPVRLAYQHPDQLTPEMNEVWGWFQSTTPGIDPARYCRF